MKKKNEDKQNSFNLKDFIFHKNICKMYILADKKIKIYRGTRTTF